jgi:hypothetical protein
MRVVRIYSSQDGESHFEDLDIRLEEAGPIGRLSDAHPVESIIFRENSPDYNFDWHNAPRRQFIVLLDGNIEIEVSDGEVRQFSGGDILLAEDVDGKGHRTRTTDGRARRSVFIVI